MTYVQGNRYVIIVSYEVKVAVRLPLDHLAVDHVQYVF